MSLYCSIQPTGANPPKNIFLLQLFRDLFEIFWSRCDEEEEAKGRI